MAQTINSTIIDQAKLRFNKDTSRVFGFYMAYLLTNIHELLSANLVNLSPASLHEIRTPEGAMKLFDDIQSIFGEFNISQELTEA
jgi:hypothetical protein